MGPEMLKLTKPDKYYLIQSLYRQTAGSRHRVLINPVNHALRRMADERRI